MCFKYVINQHLSNVEFFFLFPQIVMEYCGAGSVSDIMRLRNKTVSFYSVISLNSLNVSRSIL